MGDMQALATVMTKAVQEALMPIARYAASHLTCDKAVALLRDWETPIPFKPEALDMWRAVAELLLTGSGTFRARVTKTEGFPAGEAGQAFKDMFEKFVGELQQISGADAAITQVRRLPNPKYEAQSSEIVAVFAELLKIA